MASPVGEDNWVALVDAKVRGATDLESRVSAVECFHRAVTAEPASLRVWIAYCEFFWSLYSSPDAAWSSDERAAARDTFTLDGALKLWQKAYEAVRWRLGDSHELWDRWIAVEMELQSRFRTDAGIQRITHMLKNRLSVPHATWDATAQMLSSFLSEYSPQAYESEMTGVTRNSRDTKRMWDIREPFETRLAKATDPDTLRATMSEYLDWEIKQTSSSRGSKKDSHMHEINWHVCLGLFSRALTGVLAPDEPTWLDYMVLISTSHTEHRAGRSKLPFEALPKMLDVLQRAVHHIPWSGPAWARYILVAEESGLAFTEIERIKHAATSSPLLDRDGMTAVIDMYSAWCGYLKRSAMDMNATEEAVDVAEVGLPSALEDVKHWGNRLCGPAYQGDPSIRLERILIDFLIEKLDNVEQARAVWEQLSAVEMHANSYDFWLQWYEWEMEVFAASKTKTRSPTPSTSAQGLRVPTLATCVFAKSLKVKAMDWPETIMDKYLRHCNNHEVPEVLREAQDTIHKTKKGVAKRREREAVQAQAAAAAAAAATQAQGTLQAAVPATQQGTAMTDAASVDPVETASSPGSKRKREDSPEDEIELSSKRAKNHEQTESAAGKRDRENTSVFVTKLPSDITMTKVRQFFREYGHVNNIDLQKKDGESAVALVEFRSSEDARSALLRDEKYLGEHMVHVTPATDCTLFVTNYPPQADEQFIRNLFKGCGGEMHSVRFPSLKFNTRRRFCYVTFRDRAAAAAAVEKLDGKPVTDSNKSSKTSSGGPPSSSFKLLVKFSDPGIRQNRSGAQAEQRELHVLNLPHSMEEQDVETPFSKGSGAKVASVRVMRNAQGKSTGTAFVIMETKDDAQRAIAAMHGTKFGNRSIKVELSKALGTKVTATSRTDSVPVSSPRSAPGEEDGPGGAGSPAGDGEASAPSGKKASTSSSSSSAGKSIALLGISDTMTDARLRTVLEPLAPPIARLVLHPLHGGAILEFADAASAGKAALALNGLEMADGAGGDNNDTTAATKRRLRIGTAAELFRNKAETRVDRVDIPSHQRNQQQPAAGSAARPLMPPPLAVRRPQQKQAQYQHQPTLGRGRAKRGLGFTGGVAAAGKKKEDINGSGGTGSSSSDGPAAGESTAGSQGAEPAAAKSNTEFRKMFLGK